MKHINQGEAHGRAKLTTRQVEQIRRLYREKAVECRIDELGRRYTRKVWDSATLADRFGVQPGQIRKIVRRDKVGGWAHVRGP